MSDLEERSQKYKTGYDEQARRYDDRSFGHVGGQFTSRYKNEAIVDLFEQHGVFHQDAVLIDCPTGTGRVTHHLVQTDKPFAKIHAADISGGMLQVNKERLPAQPDKVNYIEGNMRELPLDDNSVDGAAIASFAYLVPSAQYMEFIGDIHRVLKPGGIAVIEVSNALCLYNPVSFAKVFYHHFIKRREVKSYVTAGELQRLFSPFEVVSYQGLDFPRLSGQYASYQKTSNWLGKTPFLKKFSGKFSVVLKKGSARDA